jgi:hypothetical protein
VLRGKRLSSAVQPSGLEAAADAIKTIEIATNKDFIYIYKLININKK